MKTQNTLENKAKFFAQYFGQEVLIANPHVNQKNPFKCEQPFIYHNTDIAWLELTPLSQISDEDAIEISKFYPSFGSDIRNAVKELFQEWNVLELSIETGDFLRSKGYALHYMDLSVEDLVEYGWVKLK